MKSTRGKKMVVLLGAVVLLLVLAFVAQRQARQQPIAAGERVELVFDLLPTA